ncbi:hypothetical protein D9M71_151820 [compost metagenome]
MPRLEDRRQNPDGQVQRAAAHVAEQGQWHRGQLAVAADGIEHAGQGDVIDVMAGNLGQRTGLAPAGDSPVDQARVNGQAFVRAQAQAFCNAGAEAFDQSVGIGQQFLDQLHGLRVLQVQGDGLAVAQ